MYSLYSLLVLIVAVRGVALVHLPGAPPQEVRRQLRPAHGLPARVVQHGRRRIDLDPRRLGRRSAHGPAADQRSQAALSEPAHVPVDDDDGGAAAGAPQRPGRRRGVLFSVRSRLRRPPHARSRAAEALHHDGDRDLAEPAARMPRSRHQDRGRERPAVGAIVPALSPDPPDDAPRPRSHRQVPGAERGVGAPLHRSRRRSRAAWW